MTSSVCQSAKLIAILSVKQFPQQSISGWMKKLSIGHLKHSVFQDRVPPIAALGSELDHVP
jgi:hypothetical protein